MGEKSYLKEQVYLSGLSSYDLFTGEEFAAYMEIVEAKNELNRMEAQEEKNDEEKKRLVVKKKQAQQLLSTLIKQHAGTPRDVKLERVLYVEKGSDLPAGITWDALKFNKKISEFTSELTRAMGLKDGDYTFDHVIVHWKSLDLLRQLVMDGFNMTFLNKDGTLSTKHYRFYTSSAGQLRRDKLQFISDEMWEKIHQRIECGLTWEEINRRGGVNVN